MVQLIENKIKNVIHDRKKLFPKLKDTLGAIGGIFQPERKNEDPVLDIGKQETSQDSLNSNEDTEKTPSLLSISKFKCEKPQESSSKMEHFAKLGNFAELLWAGSVISDIVLRVGKYEFNAHKVVLSCYSPYLKKKLPLVKSKTVKLIGLTPNILKILLNYMYTGELQMTCQTLVDVYSGGRKLKMKDVLEKCVEMLHGQDEDDVRRHVYLYVVARKLGFVERWMQAHELILQNFEECMNTDCFLDLTCDQLCEILSSDFIVVKSEVVVFLAAIKWLANQDPFQIENAILVMSSIRFPLMSQQEILHCFHPPTAQHVTEIPVVRNMILRGLCYASSVDLNMQGLFKDFSSNPRQKLLTGDLTDPGDSDIQGLKAIPKTECVDNEMKKI